MANARWDTRCVRSLRGLAVPMALLLLVGCGGGAGENPQASGSPSPEIGSVLQAMLDAEREAYGAPGALAVVRVGDRRWAATTGRSATSGRPVMVTDTFRLASITKPIVAALVLEAVERGELSLGDVVGDLLPGVVRDEPAVTVRMLLNHTSGIFDEINEGDPEADAARLADPALAKEAKQLSVRYAAGDRVIASARLLVALAETHDRYFAPGSGYHYSNSNYQLAAMALEKVTGHALSDLLRTGLVEPLGLRHTTIAPPDRASPMMRGYATSVTSGTPVDVTDDLLAFGNGGNGGVISNADELLSILEAIVTGRFLSTAMVADMMTAAVGTYGLGLNAYATGCGVFYGHGGAVNGTGSIALVSADGHDGVVIAQNLLSDADSDLPGLAEQMICTAKAHP